MAEPGDLRGLRRAYGVGELREEDVAAEPLAQFGRWLADAQAAGIPEPNAMVLATATPDGRPSTRVVLLKGYDSAGFRFFTGAASRKGQELAANPQASLCFPWFAMERQVVVVGDGTAMTRPESEAYFATRPYESQLGAVASRQSSVLAGGREQLEGSYAEAAAAHPAGSGVPMPASWGGWRLQPETVEFWQGRPGRLHDRLRYRRQGEAWVLERLSP